MLSIEGELTVVDQQCGSDGYRCDPESFVALDGTNLVDLLYGTAVHPRAGTAPRRIRLTLELLDGDGSLTSTALEPDYLARQRLLVQLRKSSEDRCGACEVALRRHGSWGKPIDIHAPLPLCPRHA